MKRFFVLLLFIFSVNFLTYSQNIDEKNQVSNDMHIVKNGHVEDYIVYVLMLFLTSTNVWMFFQTISKNKTQEKLKELDIKKQEIELDYTSDTKFREVLSNELLKNYLSLTNTITTDIHKTLTDIKNKIYDIEKLNKDIYSFLDTMERELKKEMEDIIKRYMQK